MRLWADVYYNPHFLRQPDSEKELLPMAFSVLPDEKPERPQPYYQKIALWRLLMKARENIFKEKNKKGPFWVVQDRIGEWYKEERKKRHDATFIRNTLPDLSSALEEYAENVNIIIDLCQKRSIRLLFVTQPAMWTKNLPIPLEELLWLGYTNKPGEYYSVEVLAEGLRQYNKTLIEVCQMRGVEYLDLANLLPKDTTVFYDDCHFNEIGAQKVAEAIAGYMLKQRPFNER
jgi:hypothetical protein